MFKSIITIICLLISTNALAGIGGSLETSYTSYTVNEPGKSSRSFSMLPVSINLYIDKNGSLPKGWGSYSGRTSGNISMIRGVPQLDGIKPLNINDQYSNTGYLGSNTTTVGNIDITSPYQNLPLTANFRQNNNSGALSFLEQRDINTILDSTSKTAVFTGAGQEITESNLTLGYKDSKDRQIRGGSGRNVFQMLLNGSEYRVQNQGIWKYIPQIVADYKKTKYGSANYLNSLLGGGAKSSTNGYLTPAETTYTIAAGKQEFWGGYRKIAIGKSIEEQFYLGNLTGTQKIREWWAYKGDRYSMDVQYSHKNDSDEDYYSINNTGQSKKSGFTSLTADFFAEWNVKIPILNNWTGDNLLSGWKPAVIKTFSTYENTTDLSGKSVILDIPIFYSSDSTFLSESAKVERKSKETTDMNSINNINITSLQYKLTLNRDGYITYSPMVYYTASDSSLSKVGEKDDYKSNSVQAGLNIATTDKLWQALETECSHHIQCTPSMWKQFGAGVNYTYLQQQNVQIERSHSLSARAHLISNNQITLDLSHFSFFNENPQPVSQPDSILNPSTPQTTPADERTINKHISTLASAYTPVFDFGHLTVNLSASQEFAKTNLFDKSTTTAYFAVKLNATSWGVTINSHAEWCPQEQIQLTNENNAIIEYLPNQIWQGQIRVQHFFYSDKTGGESHTVNSSGTGRFSIKYGQREIARLVETITYTTILQDSGQNTQTWSGSAEIHTYPRKAMDTDIYAKGAILNDGTRTDKLYNIGLTFSRQKLTFAGEWAQGWRNDGREEKKWTVSLKTSF